MLKRRFHHSRRRKEPALGGLAPFLAFLLMAIVLVAILLTSHIEKVNNTRDAAHALVDERTSTAENIRLLSSSEERALRTNPNRDHVARARALGVPGMSNREAAAALTAKDDGPFRELNSDERVWVSPFMRYGIPYVTHDTHNTLTLIADRFQEQLRELGLPPHRIVVTSVLRTEEDQIRLRKVNASAARGVSAHQFGTTADVHYRRYDYVAELDTFEMPEGVYEWLFRDIVEREMESFAATYHEQMKALLGRVMSRMHQEGKLMVTMERNQPVFHFTIDNELSDYRLAELLGEDSDAIPSSPG